jgi:hypothetical protein
MDSSWVLPAMTAAALAAVLWTMHSAKRDVYAPPLLPAVPPPPPPPPPPAKHSKQHEAATGGMGLDDVLASIPDSSIPVQKTVGGALDPVPYTDEETRHIATNILARINDVSSDTGLKWDLRIVSMDSVRKVVDPYKTLYYTLTFMAYSPRLNVGVKLVAEVVVPVSNAMYVEGVRQFSSSGGEEGPRGSRGPHTEAAHSEWVPVIRPQIP